MWFRPRAVLTPSFLTIYKTTSDTPYFKFNKATGQMTVTKSGSEHWTLHERRFVDATIQSLPFAHVLPQNTATSEFVNTAWQTAMQQALTGQITSEEMMKRLEGLFTE